MITLFGCSVSSISTVYLALKEKYSVNIVDDRWLKKHTASDILLFPSLSVLKRFRRFLKKFKGVGIVFDGPANLYGVKNLRFLDIEKKPDSLSYKFSLKKPNYALIDKAFKKPPKKIKWDKTKFLDLIVGERNQTPLLTAIASYTYFCTNHENRIESQKTIAEYLVGKIKKDQLLKQLPQTIPFYRKKMLKEFTSAYVKACRLAAKGGDPIKIAKDHKLEVADVKWPLKILGIKSEKKNASSSKNG